MYVYVILCIYHVCTYNICMYVAYVSMYACMYVYMYVLGLGNSTILSLEYLS